MPNIKSTNREFLELFRALDGVKEIKGARFAVIVGRNIKELKSHLDPIEKASIPSTDFQQLSMQVQELIQKEDKEAIETLEKENETLIEERKKQMEEVENMLDDASECFLHPIREDQLPDEITGQQVEQLIQIIE